ncbi:intercellular adhesin biosynthesis polysaccharide N-deacetylase, partial [Staphylococcus pseudintermedius]
MLNFFKLIIVIGCVVLTMDMALFPTNQAEAETHKLKYDVDIITM